MMLSCLAKRKGPGGCQIKKQGRIDFVTRTILKAMLSTLDNAESPSDCGVYSGLSLV